MNIDMQMAKSKWQRVLVNHRGFTLIELLLVVVIIGILSTLVVVNFIGIRGRARDAQRKTDLSQIRTAFQLYNSDQGVYPPENEMSSCGGEFINPATSVVYMKKIPCDPLDKSPYKYEQAPDGCLSGTICTGYTLFACLENSSDSQTDEKQQAVFPKSICDKGSPYTVTNP